MKSTTTSHMLVWAILVFCLVSISSCQGPRVSKAEDKPNILFILTDDHTYDAIHANGNDQIITPHLDKLFGQGTTFTHAYNMGGWNGAICAASRAMMISGRSIWDAREYTEEWRAKNPEAMNHTWGRMMSKAGYDTYMTGKWHVDAAATQVFDQAKNIRPGMPPHTYPWPEINALKNEDGEVVKPYDFDELMLPGYNRPKSRDDNSWSPVDSSFGGFWEGGQHWSEVVRDDAVGFLNQAANDEDPFFMYVAFNAPHDHRQSPQKYIDMYPVDDIKVPESFLPEYPYKDGMGAHQLLRDEALAPFPRTEYAVQKHIQEYYALITHLDDQVGAILDALDASGKRENTYIFFGADHGLSVGKHGLIGKQSMYDHSIRVPMALVGPDIPVGKKVNQDVYLQDIMATSLELASIEKPDYVFFNSLLGLTSGHQTESNYPEIYGAFRGLQRMIRKDGMKLIHYPKINVTRLFDMNADPLEMNDLSGQAKYAEKETQLMAELEALKKSFNDPMDSGRPWRSWQ